MNVHITMFKKKYCKIYSNLEIQFDSRNSNPYDCRIIQKIEKSEYAKSTKIENFLQ